MNEDSKCKFPEIRKELIEMSKLDQDIRLNGNINDPNVILTMAKIDTTNTKRLKEILKTVKLPSADNIGYDGAQSAWLIAQHAAHDLAFMKEMLHLIRVCTKANSKNGYYSGIPYLVDRINNFEGKKQVYGTQFYGNSEGEMQPYPIKDIKNIDKLREKYGLDSFVANEKRIRSIY